MSSLPKVETNGRLRPYASYKHSGVKWLGRTPTHWEIHRLKHVATVQPSNVDKKSEDGESPVRLCNYVDVYYNDRITADLDFMRATATEEEKRKFQLRVGDVCVTKDSEEWSDIAVPACVADDVPDLLCGYHLALVRPRYGRSHGEFLARAFSARGVNDQFRVEANGITRFALGQDALCNALFPVPPLDEQQAIAEFLDRETAKIDALVKKKERLIELLQEKRKALISHAVTQGLNAEAPKKDSGIAWLGHIPKHWEVRRIKRACSLVRDGTHLPPPRVAVGIPLLSVRNITDGQLLNLPDDSLISESDFAELQRSFQVKENDVVLAIVGATLGKVALIPNLPPFQIQRSLALLRPHPATLAFKFLFYFLKSTGFQSCLWQNVGFSAQPGIYLGALANFSITVPSLPDQKAIVVELDRETAKLDALMANVRTAIERLQEYRTALISAAVTGQIDVRASGVKPCDVRNHAER